MRLMYCMALAFILCTGVTTAQAIEAFSTPTGVLQWDEKQAYNGYTLVSPSTATTSYLIDMKGDVVHEWKTKYKPGLYAELLPNGNLLRGVTFKKLMVPFGGASSGVQELDWDGNVVWEYIISDKKTLQHHTFQRLENGNTLILGWEYKSYDEAMAKGRKPETLPKKNGAISKKMKYGGIWSDFVVEVDAKGKKVWSWHVWDYLGTGKNQFDINFILPMDGPYGDSDWTHFNTIEYIPETGQLLLCGRNFGEIYLIDKKTGKMVYRWGNPFAYGKGKGPSFLDAGDQELFGPHDSTWLGDGKIMIFDNGWQNPEKNRSRIIILDTKTSKIAWEYKAKNSSAFYSAFQGAVQMLENGNMLITSTNTGHVFEITAEEKEPEIVWEFISPWMKNKAVALLTEEHAIISPYSNMMLNYVHRAYRYAPDYAGLKGKDLSKKTVLFPDAPDFVKIYKDLSKMELTVTK